MPTVSAFTTGASPVTATSYAVDHSAVAVGQWMVVQFNMSGSTARTAAPAGWRVLVDNVGFGSRRVSVYGKTKVSGDGSSSTFTWDIALSTKWTLGYGSTAADVADWIVGICGVRNGADAVSGISVQAGDSTHTVSKSVAAPAGSLAIGISNEATTAAETGPDYYTALPAGWTLISQSNGTEWPIFLSKAMASAGATGDASVTYPNVQANNGMGVQIIIPAPGSVPMKEGTFTGSITVGPGDFAGSQPTVYPSELSVIGTTATVGVTSPYTSSTWVFDRPPVVAGDMLVVPLRSQNSAGPLPTVPSGWEIQTTAPGSYANGRTHLIATHRVDDPGTEPATYTFTQSSSLRRVGALIQLRAPAGQVIIIDTHTQQYEATQVGGTYVGAGFDVFTVPGLLIAAFGAEFTAGASSDRDSIPDGFTTLVDPTTGTDPGTTSRTQMWVGTRKLTAKPMANMVIDWVGSVTGVGFDAVLFRAVTPGAGQGSIDGTPISIGVQGYVGGFQPPKAGTGFATVTQFLATIGATSAHRGGSIGSPEMSRRAYRRAASRGYGLLEFSAQRTADGVWVGLHDADPNRTSQMVGLPAVSSMTWAQLQTYMNSLNAEGYPVEYVRLEDFLAEWTPTHIVMLDPKNAIGFVSEMNVIAANYGGPEKIIMKYAGVGASVGAVARNWRDVLGYQTWGYFYAGDVADGDLAAYQSNWTILGQEYSASQAEWDATLSYGKPVMGHIAPTQAAYDEAMLKGARFVQVSGTGVVQAVGAESIPAAGGSFGSPINVGPGFFSGVAPMEEPGVIGFGRVRGRFVAGIADGSDPGAEPDIRPMTGTVTFKSSAGSVKVPTGAPDPLTLFVQNIVVPLDAEGYLTGANGHDISLLSTEDPAGTPVGWKWTATFALQFDGKDVAAPSITFSLPVGGLVDLSVV